MTSSLKCYFCGSDLGEENGCCLPKKALEQSLRERCDTLQAQLAQYGQHTWDCHDDAGVGCTCGLEAALAGTEGQAS